MSVRRYRFAPGLVLAIAGPPGALRHFDAEYGAALIRDRGRAAEQLFERSAGADSWPPDGADVAVRFVERRGSRTPADLTWSHKGTNWRAWLGPPERRPLLADVRVIGPFGVALVQSLLVEPLVSVAASRAGLVLLPAAALLLQDGVAAVAGRSHTGKSSLAARAIGARLPILGDDRFLLESDGTCTPFPRRLRVYSDLPLTAPSFVASLPARGRLAMATRALMVRATRGFVDLPVLLPIAAVRNGPRRGGNRAGGDTRANRGSEAGGSPGLPDTGVPRMAGDPTVGRTGEDAGGSLLHRLLLLEPAPRTTPHDAGEAADVTALSVPGPDPVARPLSADMAAEASMKIVAADLSLLARLPESTRWPGAVSDALGVHRAVLQAALEGVQTEWVSLAARSARESVDAVAGLLGMPTWP